MNPTPVSAVLVPTQVFAQPNLTLQNGSIIQAIPITSGSILIGPTSMASEDGIKCAVSDAVQFSASGAPIVRHPTKGRRPKSLATEIKPDISPGVYPVRPMCRSCGKFFMSRQQLNQHMLVHTDVRKYKCTFCDRTFKQPSHLHQHHRIHTGEKPYRCPVPGCSRAFPQQSNLNHHLRNHDKPAPPPENTCSLCMRTYASETVLRSHISKIHMCDPDALIGSRKKTQTSDRLPQQSGDNVATPIFPVAQYNHVKREDSIGIISNNHCEETRIHSRSTPDSNITARIMNAFSLKNLSSLQNSDSMHNFSESAIWTNGIYSSQKVFESGLNVATDHKTDISEEETYRKPVPEKTDTEYSHVNKNTNGDLLDHFVVTTNQRKFDETDVKCTNGNVGEEVVSENSYWQSSLEIPPLVINSDSNLSTESVPTHTARSRKRKAFQPQRIIQKQDTSEEQGCVDF